MSGASFIRARVDTDVEPLALPAAVTKSDGCDIQKKAARKHRYLLSLPGVLNNIGGAGQIGELRHMDTPNPELCVVTDEGELRFKGTIQYPREQRFLTIQFPQKGGGGTVEDVFDAVVTFPAKDVVWHGKGGADFPKTTAADVAATPVKRSGRTPVSTPSTSTKKRSLARSKEVVVGEDEDSDGGDDVSSEPEASGAGAGAGADAAGAGASAAMTTPARKTRTKKARKRDWEEEEAETSEEEVASDDDKEADDDEEDIEPTPLSFSQRSSGRRRKPVTYTIESGSDSDEFLSD